MISGFLITDIILKDLECGRFSFKNFYIRRANRILPALFFMMTIVSVIIWLTLSPSEIQDFSGSMLFAIFSASNLYFIDFVDYFAPQAEFIMLLHTWSLGVEEQFYFLFPLFAYIAFRFLRGSGFWFAIIFMMTISFFISEWGWRNEPAGNYFFSLSRFWEILIGAAAARFCFDREVKGSNFFATLGLTAILFSFVFYDEDILFPSYFALAPTLGTALILVFARKSTFAVSLLQSRALRFVGLISFSIYLWHQPVFVFGRLLGYETSQPAIGITLISIILLISMFSWRFVEKPFRSQEKTHIYRRGFVLWITAIILIGLSIVGYFTSLPKLMFNEADQRLMGVTRIEARQYQLDIVSNYSRKPFNRNDPRPKVAFIGDSFSRDFMNILNERGVLNDLDVSLWLISRTCAPFFLKSLDQNLSQIWGANHCDSFDRYKSAEMLAAVATADVVVLANHWDTWHYPYVIETIKHINDISMAEIVLVGPKNFGAVSIRELLRVPEPERPAVRSAPNTSLVETNELFKTIVDISYVDIVGEFCEPNGSCPLITKSGHLISLDGTHLTRFGAIELGQVLNQRYRLRTLFGLEE